MNESSMNCSTDLEAGEPNTATLVCECYSDGSGVTTEASDTADITFSARSHRDGLWTEPVIDKVFWLLFREEDHCRVWWEHEVMRSISVVLLI